MYMMLRTWDIEGVMGVAHGLVKIYGNVDDA